MNYEDVLEVMFEDGLDSLWRGVKAMPEDKLDWQPSPEARTVRQLLEEVVMTTAYSAKLVLQQKDPGMSEEGGEDPKSLADMENAHRANVKEFMAAVREFPEAKLQDSIELPWGTMTFLQVITYPYWNLMYHWGQISYLQTMYGDKEMH